MFLAQHADGVGQEGWSRMTETLKGMSSMPKDAKKQYPPDGASSGRSPVHGHPPPGVFTSED